MLWKSLPLSGIGFFPAGPAVWFYCFRKFLDSGNRRLAEINSEINRYPFAFYTIIALTITIFPAVIAAKDLV